MAMPSSSEHGSYASIARGRTTRDSACVALTSCKAHSIVRSPSNGNLGGDRIALFVYQIPTRGYAMADFELHVTEIDEAGKDYAFELSPAWLDSHLQDAALKHDPDFGPGTLEVHAQENDGEYLVTGTVRVHVLTECGRCLGDAKLAVNTVIGTLFARTSGRPGAGAQAGQDRRAHTERHTERYERHADQDDEDNDDVPREEFSGNDIVLDELVREHIVLEVPMQPLCGEACPGIPIPAHLQAPADVFPGSGAVDPRLAPLQRLRDNVPPMSNPQPEAPSGTPAREQPGRQTKPKTKSNKE